MCATATPERGRGPATSRAGRPVAVEPRRSGPDSGAPRARRRRWGRTRWPRPGRGRGPGVGARAGRSVSGHAARPDAGLGRAALGQFLVDAAGVQPGEQAVAQPGLDGDVCPGVGARAAAWSSPLGLAEPRSAVVGSWYQHPRSATPRASELLRISVRPAWVGRRLRALGQPNGPPRYRSPRAPRTVSPDRGGPGGRERSAARAARLLGIRPRWRAEPAHGRPHHVGGVTVALTGGAGGLPGGDRRRGRGLPVPDDR